MTAACTNYVCQLHVPATWEQSGEQFKSKHLKEKLSPNQESQSVKPVLSLELKTPSRCSELRKPWAPPRGQRTSQRFPSRSCSMCVWRCACPSVEVLDAVSLQPREYQAHTTYHIMSGVTTHHSVTCVSPLKSTRLALGVLIHYNDICYLKGLVYCFAFQCSCFFFSSSSSSSILWLTTYNISIR